MTAEVVIRAEGLGKKYVIGHQSERKRYTTLRDVIGRTAHNFVRTTGDMLGGRAMVVGDSTEEFWALKEISFEVERGEVLGIIGRNGAGKSTLLKILSRITEPTKGRVQICGRVASLLEVGTGFHPELTGRENIFLNGAILGMTQREIRKKLDEIVAFAEVEKFLDTPVKRYSSGMYVRLAFAVAAHLEPEILIVDEVLAVGDANFQKKCLGKMNEVARAKARTVLLVSHNMEAILKICNRAMLLSAGQIQTIGHTDRVVSAHLQGVLSSTKFVDLRTMVRDGDYPGKVRLVQLAPYPERNNWCFFFGEEIGFDLVVDADTAIDDAIITMGINSVRGFEVATWTSQCAAAKLSLSMGLNLFRMIFRDVLLLPGQFFINIGIRSMRGFEDHVPSAVTFDIYPSDKSAQINSHEFMGALVPNVEIAKVELGRSDLPSSFPSVRESSEKTLTKNDPVLQSQSDAGGTDDEGWQAHGRADHSARA